MADKQKNPKAYTATEAVYTAGAFHNAGDVFVTDQEPNDNWTEVKPAVAHTIQASTEKVPMDIDLESLDLSALKAVAAEKKVTVTGMSKKEIITAIKAANEPAL